MTLLSHGNPTLAQRVAARHPHPRGAARALRRPTYGYAIANALADAGFGDIKGGTLYPLLSRLETNGLVETEWREGDGGPGRKYFLLSELGLRRYHQQAPLWRAFCQHTSNFIHPNQPHQNPEA